MTTHYILNRIFVATTLIVVGMITSVQAQTCPPNTGCLDTSFNGTGKVFIPTASLTHQESAVIQSDGKMVLLGDNQTTGVTLVRVDSTGALDTTFGTNGIVYTNWHFNTTLPRGYPYDIAIQIITGPQGPEERLVVVGSWTVPGVKKNTYTNDLRVDRFLPSGIPDADFGTNGTLIVHNPYALAVDIDYANRIIAVGDSGGVTRLNSDGSIDTTFGTNFSGVTGAGGSMWDVKALADGSLVFAGSCASGRDTIMCVTKLKENGAVDESFGTAGRAFANFYGSGSFSRAFAIDVDAAGNIVAGGTARAASVRNTNPANYFAAARFTSTGLLDTRFNASGRVISTVSGVSRGVHWLSDGGMIMTGTSNGPTNPDFALTRYTSAGLLDTSFGTGGKVFTDVSRGDYSQKSLLWNGTKLVVFGGSDSAPFGVSFARYVLN